jgi:7-methyl-GTP pyrophosphatase
VTSPLVLASTSRYRRALLQRLGLPFQVDSPRCDEEVGDERDPVHIVRELSLRKARSVAGLHPGAVVIGSDQVLALDGGILTKPGTAERARAQLKRLSGRTHRLVTGLALIDGREGRDGAEIVDHEDYRLTFRTLGDAEIARYVELDQPLDCAGSYKLESRGIWLIEHLDGEDDSSIVGLPLLRLTRHLRALGITPL